VSFNYRLNAVGFLALKELREGNANQTGNYGLLDVITALQVPSFDFIELLLNQH